jgi:hypothetical protein
MIVYFLISALISMMSKAAGYSDVIFSCTDSYEGDMSDSTCSGIVHWRIARAYKRANYTIYDTGPPLDFEEQDKYVMSIYQSILSPTSSSVVKSCKRAIKRFSCVAGYPACSISDSNRNSEGISVSYFVPCRLQCLQMKAACNNIQEVKNLNCNELPETTCMISLPTGYFAPSVSQEPFESLPYLYGILLIIWGFYGLYWNYATFIAHRDKCVLFCRAVAGVPLLKTLVMSIGTAFWSTCVLWKMCSFWLGVGLINTHLLYETSILVCFLLLAEGWTITTEFLSPKQWRGVVTSAAGFYMGNSILLVLANNVLTKTGVWMANSILYGLIYLYILNAVRKQILMLNSHLSLLRPTMPANIVGPLYRKRIMFYIFIVFVFFSIAGEVITQWYIVNDSHISPALFTYEIINAIVVGVIGYYFRPQEYSPFFFMVPARNQDIRTRTIPIVEAVNSNSNTSPSGLHSDSHLFDEEDYPEDLELSSLLPEIPPNDSIAANRPRVFDKNEKPSKLIVVKNAMNTISIGCLPAAASSPVRDRDRDRDRETTTTALSQSTNLEGFGQNRRPLTSIIISDSNSNPNMIISGNF